MNINERLAHLAKFGGSADGAVNRQAFSPAAAAAAAWLRDDMAAIGLDAAIDAAGNVIGTWQSGSGPAIALGSHYDTVPNGGRYDGALGVLGAISAVENLRAKGFKPARPVMVIAFNGEDWQISPMLGSLAVCGDLDMDFQLKRGVPDIMRTAGFDFEQLPGADRLREIGAFLELHVEQGPVLEAESADIGVVSGVVGSRLYMVRYSGEANHAGTTPFALRRDALLGAAEAVLAVRRWGAQYDARATVGTIEVQPGGLNIIPGYAEIGVDVRTMSVDALHALAEKLPAEFDAIAAKHGLRVETDLMLQYEPLVLDEAIRTLTYDAACTLGLKPCKMPSGAGHDARNFGLKGVPAGIIFVPSAYGVSHSPAEYTSPAQCDAGVAVLQSVLEHML